MCLSKCLGFIWGLYSAGGWRVWAWQHVLLESCLWSTDMQHSFDKHTHAHTQNKNRNLNLLRFLQQLSYFLYLTFSVRCFVRHTIQWSTFFFFFFSHQSVICTCLSSVSLQVAEVYPDSKWVRGKVSNICVDLLSFYIPWAGSWQ